MINTFRIIAHRGLLLGPNKDKENLPTSIFKNIEKYPYLINEIDIWIGEHLFLGHDEKQYKIDIRNVIEYKLNLILHIKEIALESSIAIDNLLSIQESCHFFSHDQDDFAVTSQGWIWMHPRCGIIDRTICVMPEKFIPLDSGEFREKIKTLTGVCTDYPMKLLD